ncbi:MAG: transketolase family protein [Clostridia bacterium]|nr:transketolase family protein [Clostridia bacterium]
MEMRKVLAETMEELMLKNKDIVLINADLAKPNGLGNLKDKFPDRAFNIGIAEQNMASIAAGMSSYGFIPFISTFTPFASRRICDQIAISCAYAKQNVKIIATDPGISAENNGGTHMSFEDIGVLRSIPGVVIFEPVDKVQLKKILPQIAEYKGVVYIRTFRKELPDVFSEDEEFDLFSSAKLQDGKDASIFCTGIMVQETLLANKILQSQGINADIINIHTIKPIDKSAIVSSAKKTGAVVTAENHNLIGGLRSAVCEVLAEQFPVYVGSIGIDDKFGQVGKMPFLKEFYKLRAEDIVNKVHEVLTKSGK